MNEFSWDNSNCDDGWLHRFVITRQWNECIEETCTLCGHQAYFKVINGKSNNDIYLAHHIRQCLFPQHPLFNREFPFYKPSNKTTSINE